MFVSEKTHKRITTLFSDKIVTFHAHLIAILIKLDVDVAPLSVEVKYKGIIICSITGSKTNIAPPVGEGKTTKLRLVFDGDVQPKGYMALDDGEPELKDELTRI